MAVLKMKSPMGEPKYVNLATLALELLAIPASNADSERVFSLVRRVKTDFRASLAPETLSSLIGCHFNMNANCCQFDKIDDALIKKAKTWTLEGDVDGFFDQQGCAVCLIKDPCFFPKRLVVLRPGMLSNALLFSLSSSGGYLMLFQSGTMPFWSHQCTFAHNCKESHKPLPTSKSSGHCP